MSVKRFVRNAATAATAAAILGIGGVALTTSSAAADPVGVMADGGSVNRCTAEYFTNRWSTRCDSAQKEGYYRTAADCEGTNSYGAWTYINQWATVRGFSSGTCYPAIVNWAAAQYKAS
ncbi:hypothetical protein [Streptosporangium sp. CA-115845]|uniref:hypothetical protein n=1 Tax=Streptosporangium sp. CA-115845 TaxID=3240071 RepID=UPI003D8F58AA